MFMENLQLTIDVTVRYILGWLELVLFWPYLVLNEIGLI